MAPSLIYSAFLALLLTFLCICKADLIEKVCSHSENPPLCKKTLASDPRSHGADLQVLGDICIDKALPPTQLVKNIATKYKFKVCIEYADSALDELRECRGLLKTAHGAYNISTLRITATAVYIDVGTCIDEYENEMPADLKQAIGLAMDPITVLLSVVHSF